MQFLNWKSLLDLSHARISSGSFHAPSKTRTAVLSARCARFGDPLKRCVHGSRWFRVAIAQFVSICIRREINKSIPSDLLLLLFLLIF